MHNSGRETPDWHPPLGPRSHRADILDTDSVVRLVKQRPSSHSNRIPVLGFNLSHGVLKFLAKKRSKVCSSPLFSMFLSSSLVFTLSFLILHIAAWDCTSLTSLSLPNVTITDANHLVAGSTFNASADPTCFMPTYKNTVEICRVVGAVATSPTSTVKFEMWLPETWYGRVLTGGNGGLGGCKYSFSCCLFTHLIPVQASNTRSSTMPLLSTLPRSGRTMDTTEASPLTRSSTHLVWNPSKIFPIERYM